MKVRIVAPASASPDGITVNNYLPGQKVDLTDAQAQLFIDRGWAVEDKDMSRAPEIKTSAPQSKRKRR
jgi:hypothetical protein